MGRRSSCLAASMNCDGPLRVISSGIPPPQTAPTMAAEKARQEIARTTRTGIPSEGASAILERIGLAE